MFSSRFGWWKALPGVSPATSSKVQNVTVTGWGVRPNACLYLQILMMIYRLMWDFGSYQLNLSPWKINILNPKVRKEGTVESHVEVFFQRIFLFNWVILR